MLDLGFSDSSAAFNSKPTRSPFLLLHNLILPSAVQWAAGAAAICVERGVFSRQELDEQMGLPQEEGDVDAHAR